MIYNVWTERFLADKKREQDHRSPFQRDRARILHSEAFRCLQAKTQIHAVGEDDFYRTRLTHSLEVAQIGSSIRAKLLREKQAFQAVVSEQKFANFAENLTALLPSRSLIESLCFAHDIGHPPFGHGGEMALNYKMRAHGGFEGNAQSFRIVTQLEPYTPQHGMNLTRRTLLGIIKYPALLEETEPQARPQFAESPYINLHQFKTCKGIFSDDQTFFDWVLAPLSEQDRNLLRSISFSKDPFEPHKTQYKSLDCSIMELADDIAYGVHDLEDAIAGGMVTPQSWQQAQQQLAQCSSNWIQTILPTLSQKLFSQHRYERKDVIGALVNYFVTNVQWREQPGFDEPLLRFNAYLPDDVKCVLEILKRFVYQYVICDVKTQRVEYKGQRILMALFDMLSTDPERLLPQNVALRWQQSTPSKRPRVICDYLAGMSDGQAFKLYQSL
ncbi:anti-phage deoxyguanosine triphosphatase [Actinobacillus pleuropneumoniae]|uniref:Deoxyguanosinetriphosphate triphosphohydrolase-like protein n=1 Tax=Actinobacillus pleuropneumoniae serotype 7 (strain AP76) TaxID=537457 RepID=B3H0F8_ACTP7|nr:anti-phage deoxyguanosine triphosphatase [Actinobacillus pleuropneumoniae]ACE60970.1 deoxyguanosinetriphosphate triphosphohydrolase- like protein [Actinobacillus pleuropneumoniae serovar 7 str. AP76]UKH38448.1 deoxyguanosinetriphosphate triphosphohydrolase family protein [Actinobacillus pleuropneumoniae]UQZ26039.1 deoxyguanosinetriphosphate triphosphohydrolase family protein [Actinobacillus pleuropneumoniae]